MVRISFIASVALLLTTPVLAQGQSESAPGQDRVCLVTFNKAGTTANADVTSAKILPRKAAEAQESDTMKIFEYGDNGELTQEACECLNNESTRAACDQPVRG
jgi:hypothetical protein